MREIKFRAWDKVNNKMLEIGNPFDGYYTIDDDGVHFGDLVTFGSDLENYEFMQYTGLKDEKGVEIYEGDIIEEYGEKCIVEWHKNGWFVRDVTCSLKEFVDKYVETYSEMQARLYGDVGEVIGNIYENPELLEDK